VGDARDLAGCAHAERIAAAYDHEIAVLKLQVADITAAQ
jgi:hypothetical protein